MKDPAFLFYYQDFLVGTDEMTNEEVGAYIRCLCHQAAKGFISEKHMKNICYSSEVHNYIKTKFIFNPDSKIYFNERLKSEIEKRKKFTESRAINRIGKKKDKEHMNNTCKSYDIHMENENENENINKDSSFKGGMGEKINFERVYNTGWMMSVYSILEGKLTPDQLTVKWSEFQKEMTARDDLYRTPEEYRRHFPSWVKFNLEKKPVNGEKQSGIQKPNYELLNQI